MSDKDDDKATVSDPDANAIGGAHWIATHDLIDCAKHGDAQSAVTNADGHLKCAACHAEEQDDPALRSGV